jgi:hypothetical protein
MELLVMTVIVIVMYHSNYWARMAGQQFQWLGQAGVAWLFRSGIPCFFIGVLIIVMAMGKGAVSRLLSRSFPVWLGEISYSVFLVHQILIRFFTWKEGFFQLVPGFVAYVIFWIILLLAAHLIWTLIEKPGRDYILRILPELPPVRVERPSILSVPNFPQTTREVVLARKGGPIFLTRYWLIATVLSLITLMVPIWYFAQNQPMDNAISEQEAEKLAKQGRPELRNVRFGSQFVLIGGGATVRNDGLTLEFAWKSCERQRLKYFIALHLVDKAGKILHQCDYPQDSRRRRVSQGTIWCDVVTIPSEKLRGASAVALGVYVPRSPAMLTVDRGLRDWANHRLLIMFE